MPRGTLTVDILPEEEQKLESLAERLRRPSSQLVHEAIAGYLEIQQWQIEETRKAISEADAGDFATEEEIRHLNERFTGR
ncbi:MAG: ribbon-helix-helix protein, CopG family [Acidobacteria bacterium]|nr:ribbon-helix-helix protein, CopG family [Acidobacteriota bacterium]